MRIKYLVFSGLISITSLMMLLLIFQISFTAVEAAQLENSNGGWIDQFDSTTLDSRWEWIREDPTHWSLTERPGFLRITTQEGWISLGTNTGKNLLLTNPTMDDFQITTKLSFAPTEGDQRAGLVIYQDDDHYVQITRRYGDQDLIVYRHEDGEDSPGWGIIETATTVYLRIAKFGYGYTGSYSIDGNNWTALGKFNTSFVNPKVGLMAWNGRSTLEIPADFDYFQLSEVGKTLYVAPEGDCGEASPCYATIQEAVDTAESFDTIKVAASTYDDLNMRPRDDITTTGYVTQVVYLTKSINLQGGFSHSDWTTPNPQTNVTTIDAQGKGRVIYVAGDINPSIQGFTITGGDAAGLGGWDSDDVDSGGGIYVISATITISNSLIYDNQALDGRGGGVFLGEVDTGTASNNIFQTNTARTGGGIELRSARITIINNIFKENTATNGGGGISTQGSGAELIHNLVIDNHSNGSGGGLGLAMFGGNLERNLISSNTANHNGGGISVLGVGTWTNNVLIDNYAKGSGSALFIQPGGPDLIHTTLARNHGGDGSAIFITEGGDPDWRTSVNLINTIFVSHSIGISITAGHTVTVDSVLLYDVPTPLSAEDGSLTSIININHGDPLFANDGYHLTAGSAAIDKGVDAGVTVDIDDEPRPAGAGYDLGADELWIVVYMPMVTNK